MSHALDHPEIDPEQIVRAVPDPELVAVTIGDLGIVRGVDVQAGHVDVVITPTYTGCPAVEMIADRIREALAEAGYRSAVHTVLAPAWSTDWITERGRRQLTAAGIAPPAPADTLARPVDLPPTCPRCGSRRTELASWFGSTLCKSAHRCRACDEPFEYVKPL